MNADPLAEAAARLADAFRGQHVIASACLPAPTGVADAYRVQDAVLAALSPARVGAWKVSPPNPAYGITASPIPSQCLHAAPVSLPAPPSGLLGVEAEIAFRVGRDLAAGAEAPADGEIFAAIDTALAAIELCTTRLADWKDAPMLWRLADFQSNGALVVGTGVTAWRELDFGAQAVQLWVDGALRTEAAGSHPSRDPSRLVPWLVRHAARRGRGLMKGDIVTTGSWIGLVPIAPGNRIEVRFPGIGSAALDLLA